MGLIVDPGGYWPCSARLNSGRSGESLSVEYARRLMPFTKQIAIVGRRGRHSQHTAGRRIQRDDRAPLIAQRLHGGALQIEIEMQDNILARDRREPIQHAQDATVGIGLHVLVPDLPMQLTLVVTLDADLSYLEGAAVLRGIERLQLALVDAPDIAESMGQQFSVRIVPKELRLHHDAGQSMSIDCKTRLLLFTELKTQGYGIIGTAPLELATEFLHVVIGQRHEFPELRKEPSMSATRSGMTDSVWLGRLSARRMPLRSKISPRFGGSACSCTRLRSDCVR